MLHPHCKKEHCRRSVLPAAIGLYDCTQKNISKPQHFTTVTIKHLFLNTFFKNTYVVVNRVADNVAEEEEKEDGEVVINNVYIIEVSIMM